MITSNCLKIALAAVAAALIALPARAQQAIEYGAIDGAVVDTSGVGLPSVEVILLDDTDHPTRTNGSGGYRFDHVPAGPHLIRFRRLGVRPTTASIVIAAGSITSADAVLGILPHELPIVRVQSLKGEEYNVPLDVAWRMKYGQGHYLSLADIERRHPIALSDVFGGIAGVRVEGSSVHNTRGVTSLTMQIDPTTGVRSVQTSCTAGMSLYIDGVALDAGDTEHTQGGNPMSMISPSELVAVEIYKDQVELPASLPHSNCGAIFLWTKRF